MNHRNAVWLAVAIILSFMIIFWDLGWFSSEPSLEVMLRCYDGVSGTLSIAQDSEGSVEQHFDAKAACEEEGIVTFKDYNSQWPVRFAFERNNSEIAEVISKYGPDIQVDMHDGFYLVLKLMDDPPFIANDHI